MAHIEIKAGAIYDVCKSRKISRAQLARECGVTEATAYRIEQRRTNPGVKFIAALMIATGQPFEGLFVIVDDASDKSSDEAA